MDQWVAEMGTKSISTWFQILYFNQYIDLLSVCVCVCICVCIYIYIYILVDCPHFKFIFLWYLSPYYVPFVSVKHRLKMDASHPRRHNKGVWLMKWTMKVNAFRWLIRLQTHIMITTFRFKLLRKCKSKETHYVNYTLYKLCMHAELLQLCPIFCNPMDCSPPGSSAHGILQARILEWAAIFYSRGSSQPIPLFVWMQCYYYYYYYYYYFACATWHERGLSSLTRDGTCAPCSRSPES